MADTTENTAPAALMASFAAGPVALLLYGLGSFLSGQEVAMWIDERSVAPAAAVGLVLFFFALIVAIVPNLLGTLAMGWLGARNVGLRHPAVWGLAGAAAAGIPVWLSASWDTPDGIVAWWAGMGAISATLCRRGIRWRD